MENIVGVRFQEAGRIYYFTSAGYDTIEVGEYVVVETVRGEELARVVIAPGQVINAELTEPLKPITRLAYAEDLEQAEGLKLKAAEDVARAKKKASDSQLPMKIVFGSYNLDGSRLTLFFTSEGRVDFRDLVRDLSYTLGVHVQLRQVGPRDQAKVVGGYGRCGRRLCCSSWLVSFPAISIKMAKEQDLPLNPSKISGQCGRLLCCLSYENDLYRQVKQALPRPGTYVSTPTGNARVQAVNVPRELVTLHMETGQVIDVPIQELGLDRGLVRVLTGPPGPTPTPIQVRPSVVAETPALVEARTTTPTEASRHAAAPPRRDTPASTDIRRARQEDTRNGSSLRPDRGAQPGNAAAPEPATRSSRARRRRRRPPGSTPPTGSG